MKTSANSHTGPPLTSGSSNETRGVSAKTSTSLGISLTTSYFLQRDQNTWKLQHPFSPSFSQDKVTCHYHLNRDRGHSQIKNCSEKDCAKQSPRLEAECSNPRATGLHLKQLDSLLAPWGCSRFCRSYFICSEEVSVYTSQAYSQT